MNKLEAIEEILGADGVADATKLHAIGWLISEKAIEPINHIGWNEAGYIIIKWRDGDWCKSQDFDQNGAGEGWWMLFPEATDD